MKYDYLVVGAGLFGSVFANEMTSKGKSVLVIDKRPHIGGNVYTKEIEGINVHMYGAHIFHTSDKEIWDYINKFASFNNFINSPIARYKNETYNLPFNMNTYNQMWGASTPQAAALIIKQQVEQAGITTPQNLEQQAISLVGMDIYSKLIKGYTEKQWGRSATELPTFIIKRLPVRFTYDNNYFDDKYQGIPCGGYTKIIESMLSKSNVNLNTNYFLDKESYDNMADKVVYTGMIDEYYDYRFGKLDYRSLRFDTILLNEENFQGNAVVNYTDSEVAYTRIIEHKHFEYGKQEKTVISKEYSAEWTQDNEPFYPINDDKNSQLYLKYFALAKNEHSVIFGGRLASYKYFNMDEVIKSALCLANMQY